MQGTPSHLHSSAPSRKKSTFLRTSAIISVLAGVGITVHTLFHEFLKNITSNRQQIANVPSLTQPEKIKSHSTPPPAPTQNLPTPTTQPTPLPEPKPEPPITPKPERLSILKDHPPSKECPPPANLDPETKAQFDRIIANLKQLRNRWKGLKDRLLTNRKKAFHRGIAKLAVEYLKLDMLIDDGLFEKLQPTQIEEIANLLKDSFQNMKEAIRTHERYISPEQQSALLEHMWNFITWFYDSTGIDLSAIVRETISTDTRLNSTAYNQMVTLMEKRLQTLQAYSEASTDSYPQNFIPHLLYQISPSEQINLATEFANHATGAAQNATTSEDQYYRATWALHTLDLHFAPALNDSDYISTLTADLRIIQKNGAPKD